MTSISVKNNTWEELNKLKKPGNTMDDVIRILLDNYKQNTDETEITTISEEEFDKLLDELITDDEEFNSYLEESRKSFSKGV